MFDNSDNTYNDSADNHICDAIPFVSRFRHFGDEWQQICQTLLSCERLLTVMSNERPDTTGDDRQQLRQIIQSIEPKKYSSKSYRRQSQQQTTARRSSYHRLKALTQLLMTSNLKRSTSLQSVPAVTTTTPDDTTATLPRLRRRPKINRFYRSLDVNCDDTNDFNTHKADRSGLSLQLSSSPSAQHLPQQTTAERQQKQLNRHSCDVTSLLLSPSSQSSSNSQTNKQILKYSKKRLRGPYGEMLESMMNTKNNCAEEEVKQSLSFIQELLKETEKQRKTLDKNAKETTGTKDMSTTPDDTSQQQSATELTTVDDNKTSITATIGRHLDARTHIVGELYDTEKSFCEQLKDLIEKYSKPLNENLIIDTIFVEIIFGKIPEILEIHSKFLEELRHRITCWSSETTIGDLFSLFEEKSCFDCYLSFVDNWFESKQLIKQLSREKPLFNKFLLEQSREHRSKLSLDELMISVIQRIPRFELLLKQLLKNTSKEHKDYQLLSSALNKIHSLVLYINRVKNDADSSSLSSTSTVGQLDVNNQFLSISVLNECCDGLPLQHLIGQQLYLISGVLIRKRERILLLFSNILAIISMKGRKKSEKFEENKYKVLNYFFIEFLEIQELCEENEENNYEILEKDYQIIQTIQTSFLTRLSTNSKHFLESVLLDLNTNLLKRISELKSREKNLELIINDRQTTPEQKTNENTISLSFLSQEKRQKFETIFKELKSEKMKTNSKIIPEFLCFLPIRKTRAGLQFTCASPTIGTNDVWICNSDGFVGQISVLSLNGTTQTTIEPTIVSSNGVCNSRIICMTCVPKSHQNSSNSQTSEESEVSDSESDTNAATDRTRRQLSSSRSSLSSATMWFGTDDSSVHIYSCFDAIRIKKNKVKVTLSARVEAITYFSDRVFVSLANQSVAVFERDLSGCWNIRPMIRENVNCFRFCCVDHRLWTCGHNSRKITIRDVNLDPLFDDILVDDISNDDFITQMVSVDDTCRVFISTHNSLSIHCFSSSEPFIHLSNISIQNTLNRALINCEDIIRQHKSACLKISSLLAVKEMVWMGTSAGIICVLDSNSLDLEIVANGHTGHVRFLTMIKTDLNKTLVISGGDGIELYKRTGHSLTSGQADNGRDDSTNHVILWQISDK